MVKRYGHIGQMAQRQAVALLSGATFDLAGAQKWAQSANGEVSKAVN
jgi:hypothetical protein